MRQEVSNKNKNNETANGPGVLILDAHLKSALAAIRSLGSKGIRVVAASDRRTAMGLYSKYVERTFLYPSPLTDRSRFLESICRETENAANPAVLYTFSDATFLPSHEQRCGNGRLISVVPASERSVAIAYDKVETLRLATKMSVEIPPSCFLEGLGDLQLLSWGNGNPVVVKPRRSTTWRAAGSVQSTPSFVFSAEEAKSACQRVLRETGELPFLQEYVDGEELGAEYLCEDGRVVAAFAHLRIRSLSPVGGAAVVKQAIAESYKGIGECARRLIAELRWSGPIMVEFKVDRRDGRPKLLEINGRFWGSLPLAVMAGVDFPWLYYCLATGQNIASPPAYQTGMVSRHWMGDLIHLTKTFANRDAMRSVAYPKRFAALRQFLFPPVPMRSDVMSWSDMRPGFMELSDTIVRAIRHFAAVKQGHRAERHNLRKAA